MPMLWRKHPQNGKGGVTDRFAFVRFVVWATLSLEDSSRDDPYGRRIVGGPGIIHSRVKGSEKPRTNRWLPGDFLRIRQRLVEPLGHNRGGACCRCLHHEDQARNAGQKAPDHSSPPDIVASPLL